MNRLKVLLPRLGLIVAGLAIGLLARQILGPPEEDGRPKLRIDRPISDNVKLDDNEPIYVPVNLPIEKQER